jgi:hypothetical protein
MQTGLIRRRWRSAHDKSHVVNRFAEFLRVGSLCFGDLATGSWRYTASAVGLAAICQSAYYIVRKPQRDGNGHVRVFGSSV